MGTLFNQSVRNGFYCYDVESITFEIGKIERIVEKTGFTIPQVIEVCKMLEMRRQNDLYKANGDIFDEQMAGFGEIARDLAYSIITKNLEDNG